ncbi:serine hydrolase domain-containing protein [Umezawaea beigongshangensis]|uniref:serine hydrolase domain-containing protein n=1 Tax=Umezawaea beigongshangensis TaxID=2780383 RepID=UPI0027DBB931|nr:serine hydrolase domain-containing protein [Umezawaea beigongshangensis]
MRRTTRATALVSAVLAAVVCAAPAAQADTGGGIDRAAVQKLLDELVDGGAAGVQVRITDGRDVLVARSGVAELGSDRPVPRDGRFRAGSITKTFVASVVLQLVADGRVSLDAPVSRHLPGLLPDGDAITVRMLLQHTSGLFNYTNVFPEDDLAPLQRHWDPEELVALATARPLDFPPGTAWNYSNTNYVVAGMLVERVTGRPYGEVVRQRVLRPLGMRSTLFPGDRTTLPEPHAHGYVTVGGAVVDATEINPSGAWAAGEVVTTTADLDRFTAALLSGRVVPPAQLAEMTRTTEVSPDYGLGLQRETSSCGVQAWGHAGGIPGYLSLMLSTRDSGTRMELSMTTDGGDGSVESYLALAEEVFCG